MNPAKCDDLDYINFLIAAKLARRLQGASQMSIMHQLTIPSIACWKGCLKALRPSKSKELVNLSEGVLMLDDTALDKPCAEKMEHVTHHGAASTMQ